MTFTKLDTNPELRKKHMQRSREWISHTQEILAAHEQGHATYGTLAGVSPRNLMPGYFGICSCKL